MTFDSPDPRSSLTPQMLSYAQPGVNRLVTVTTYGSELEAALPAESLRGVGICCRLTNTNVNNLGFHLRALSPVELQVFEGDLPTAREHLETLRLDNFDPAPDPPDDALLEASDLLEVMPAAAAPPMHRRDLAIVAVFDQLRLMRKAQTALASAHINSAGPRLVRRSPEHPPVQGKRFELRVMPDDLERAAHVLAEDVDDAPRCPRCGAWRLFPIGQGWQKFLSLLLGRPMPTPQTECLGCHFRAAEAEFVADASATPPAFSRASVD